MANNSRSLTVTKEGIGLAKKALTGKMLTQEKLANNLDITRDPVSKFFTGKPVDRQIFVRICKELEMDWEEAAGQTECVVTEDAGGKVSPLEIDELVNLAKARSEKKVREQCGTMRVLNMEQPIDLNEIYTDVNILEKLTSNRRLDISELLRQFNPEDFQRWGLSEVKQERIEGIEAVKNHDKLMILGKPGAGKTTFLKFLTLACLRGDLFPDRVPTFIALRDFAENFSGSLLQYISKQYAEYGIPENTPVRRGFLESLLKRDTNAIEMLLTKGRMLVLLDGLDEVREKDDERVLREIREFAEKYSENQIILTCRIAAKQYIFDKFTEVEIADFNEQQISSFAENWYRGKQVKSEKFLTELKKRNSVLELATSPLLLTLLCLVFEDSGDFPVNRAELYEEGLDALLRKWDANRGIQRDSVYKDLSVQKKEDMLSQIALTTFEAGDYFFKQKQLESYICDYIRNAPNAKTEEKELQLDGEVVLKSIEAQHGLFVERARGLYSFSHRTFHEYFAARQIVSSTTPEKLKSELQKLSTKITDKRWREVLLLSVEMAKEADYLLILMKQEADKLLAENQKTLLFSQLKKQALSSVNSSFKQILNHAYNWIIDLMFSILSGLYRSISTKLRFIMQIIAYIISLMIYILFFVGVVGGVLPLIPFIGYFLAFSLLGFTIRLMKSEIRDKIFEIVSFNIIRIDNSIAKVFDRLIDYLLIDRTLANTIEYANAIDFNQSAYFRLAFNFDIELSHALKLVQKGNNQDFYQRLKSLKEKYPNPSLDRDTFKTWWQANGESWIEEFWLSIKEYRFKDKLEPYIDATKLLLECLNSGCYVQRETRQQIENSLALSIAQLKTDQDELQRSLSEKSP